MDNRLERVRQLMKQAEENKNASVQKNFSDNIFDFKDLKYGDMIRIRFVEDKEQQSYFMRPKCFRTLAFNGVKTADGAVYSNKAYVNIPAYTAKKNESDVFDLPAEYFYTSVDDPCQQKIGPLYDGTDIGAKLYKQYKQKMSYVFYGFVHAEGYEKDKLYRFMISKSLYDIIASFADDTEVIDWPVDKEVGHEFILKVTKKIANINGVPTEMKDYSTSKWSINRCPLTQEELAVWSSPDVKPLKTYIYKKPNEETFKVMMDMLNTSLEEGVYDVAKWGNYFKPNNIRFDSNGNIVSKDGLTKVSNDIPHQEPQRQVLVDSPVQTNQTTVNDVEEDYIPYDKFAQTHSEVPEQTVDIRTTIKENTVSVAGESPNDVVNNIMAQLTGK